MIACIISVVFQNHYTYCRLTDWLLETILILFCAEIGVYAKARGRTEISDFRDDETRCVSNHLPPWQFTYLLFFAGIELT